MTVTYVAHIIIRAAEGLDEITVATRPSHGERADEIATYPLIGGIKAEEALADAGWRVTGAESKAEAGYVVLDVEPANMESIIRHVAIARDHAEAVFLSAHKAWRTVLRDATLNSVSASEIAAIAMVQPEQIEQVLAEADR